MPWIHVRYIIHGKWQQILPPTSKIKKRKEKTERKEQEELNEENRKRGELFNCHTQC